MMGDQDVLVFLNLTLPDLQKQRPRLSGLLGFNSCHAGHDDYDALLIDDQKSCEVHLKLMHTLITILYFVISFFALYHLTWNGITTSDTGDWLLCGIRIRIQKRRKRLKSASNKYQKLMKSYLTVSIATFCIWCYDHLFFYHMVVIMIIIERENRWRPSISLTPVLLILTESWVTWHETLSVLECRSQETLMFSCFIGNHDQEESAWFRWW